MKLKKGQKWYVQLGKNCTLVERKIIDVTEKTVYLINVGEPSWNVLPQRYIKKDIKFVELLE